MLNAVAPLAKILFSTIEKSVPDKDLQAKLKADLQTQLLQSNTQELQIKDRQSNDRLNIAKEKLQLAREKQNKQ